jgi:hypothetical protein
MSRFRIRLAGFFSMLALITAAALPAGAAEKSAAELLPPSTVAYLQINRPKDLTSFIFDSPLHEQIDQSEGYRKALDAPKFKEFQAVLGMIEKKAGVQWRKALETTTDGGLVLAFDAQTQGVVLLSKSADPKMTDAVRDAFFSLVRGDATNKGNPDPIERKDYRGLTAFKIGDGVIANIGPWLLLANKAALAKDIADHYLDGGPSLAAIKGFAASESLNKAGSGSTAWAFVQLEPLRAMGDQAYLDPKYKSDNPAVEFLLGGLLPIARKAEYISAGLSLTSGNIKLTVDAPIDAAELAKEKRFFYSAAGDGAANPLRPDGTMLSVSMYRDASALWQAGPDLFNEAVATQMAQAESGLSTFFGGKSFGTDVLGAFKPQVQIIAAKQDYKVAGVKAPALRLPGFALAFRVKDAQFSSLRKHMRIGFQTAIAFANLDGASKGRPALELQTEKRGNADIQFATYDMTDKPTAKDDAYLNFSPAMVMSTKYMMLCSTKQIAEQLADLADKEGDVSPTIDDNTVIEFDGAAIASVIKDDREQLIAQNMLEKGHDRAAAEKEVDLFQTLVNYVQDAKLRLTPGEHDMKLEIDVKTSAVK